MRSMFRSLCIIPIEPHFPLDIGFVAESLLFYKKVIIVISQPNVLLTLLKNCDINLLTQLLSEGRLVIYWNENHLGVQHVNVSPELYVYDLAAISLENSSLEGELFRGIFKLTNRRGYSKRTTQKLLPYVKYIGYDLKILDMVRADIMEKSFVKESMLAGLGHFFPNRDWSKAEFEFNRFGSALQLKTNVDFNGLSKDSPNRDYIAPPNLLLNILTTRGEMHMASSLDSEIATNPINTAILKFRFKEIYEKSTKKKDNIYQFNELTLPNGYALRETINAGEKSFAEFVTVLKNADKFRLWLDKIGEDQNILKEYLQAVTRETKVDKLPAKLLRWSIFTGAGLALDVVITGGVATLVGLGLSAGDAFLLDKVIKGWNPSVFVKDDLTKFITKK